ncbi:unnamed protein product [Schistocephalus solidus]|uniref:Uncharacterized protein n=1 Tax=Schistocephalus solidus TaxID=70667 RepID=A0A183TN67_SCHSO|nr:unnamed protein product [Schistocephalus solidus]
MTTESNNDDHKQYRAEITTSKLPSDSILDMDGGFIADNSAKIELWHEHFYDLHNFDYQCITSSFFFSRISCFSSPFSV